MQITASSSGFAFLALPQTAEEAKYLKAARWTYHPAPSYCKIYKSNGQNCLACRSQIPPNTWYTPSQGCGSSQHPATALVGAMNPAAAALFQRVAQTSVMSRAEASKIYVPAPEGKKYLPFQLAGIEFALQRQHTLIADEPGLGKAQPLDAKILTPDGWAEMGDMTVGQEVIGSNGNFSQVTGVFPQGWKDIYRLRFENGAVVECCLDHLWKVQDCEDGEPFVIPLWVMLRLASQSAKNYIFPSVKHYPGLDGVLVSGEGQVLRDVERVGMKEAQCISVDAPDRLYVTNDYIVTHNTIQAIGFVNFTKPANVLVVCPASLRRNWQRELDRWLVDAQGSKVFVVSYEQAKTEYNALVKVPWDVLVLDEAHYLKNPKAARTKVIFGVDEYTTPHMLRGRAVGGHSHTKGIFETATRVLALTGTPIANRPKDAWTIVHALAPSVFPKYMDFAKRYCDATSEVIAVRGSKGKKGGLRKVWKFDGQSNLPELGEKLRASIMIRREKMAVLKDLPDKTRQILPLDLKSAKAHKSFDRRVGKLIGEKLKQAEGRGDFKAFGAMIQQVIPFDEMARVRKEIGLEKLPAVMAFLDERLCLDREKSKFESDEKLVVFAHHREVLSTIKTAYGKHCVLFWGGMSDNQRAAAVDAFQNDPEVRVFAGQIQASGTGLTLTASSTVVFAELDWVPANLVQAEDRIHRIGQKQSALAIYLVVDGSLEARMAYLLAEKDEVIRAALR